MAITQALAVVQVWPLQALYCIGMSSFTNMAAYLLVLLMTRIWKLLYIYGGSTAVVTSLQLDDGIINHILKLNKTMQVSQVCCKVILWHWSPHPTGQKFIIHYITPIRGLYTCTNTPTHRHPHWQCTCKHRSKCLFRQTWIHRICAYIHTHRHTQIHANIFHFNANCLNTGRINYLSDLKK